MNRHITIDFPYDQITLEFKPETLRKPAAPLRSDYWRALEAAEQRIHFRNAGANGWTDVMPNDGDEFLNAMWVQAQEYVENEWEYDRPAPEKAIIGRTASRVAQALAVLAFGADVLLLG
jgi:hypothetical protein